MSEPIGVMPEVCHAPYNPGLPRSTRVTQRFPPLKRRTQFSPPLPWDGEGMAAYASTIPKQIGGGDGSNRAPRNFWRKQLEPLQVDQSTVVPVSQARAGMAAYFWGQELGRVYRTNTEPEGVRITRVE